MRLFDILDQYRLPAGAMKFLGQEVPAVLRAESEQVLAAQKLRRQDKKGKDDEADHEDQRIALCIQAALRTAPRLVQHANHILEEEDKYKKATARAGDYHPMMAVVDKDMDAAVIATEHAMTSVIKVMGEDDPLLEAAKALQKDVFNKTAASVADEPYVEELALIEMIVEKMRAQAALVQDLGLMRYLQRMESLLPSYRHYLKAGPPPKKSYAPVAAAEGVAHETLLEFVAQLLSVYPTNDPAHVEGRGRLFAGLAARNAEVAAERRSSRRKEKNGSPKPIAVPVAPAPVAPADDNTPEPSA